MKEKIQWIIALEWKPQDLWIGAYWKKTQDRTDIWICLVPMLPIHIAWWKVKPPTLAMVEQKPVVVHKSDVGFIDTRPSGDQSRFF